MDQIATCYLASNLRRAPQPPAPPPIGSVQADIIDPPLGSVKIEDLDHEVRLWADDGESEVRFETSPEDPGTTRCPAEDRPERRFGADGLTRLIGRWRNWVKIDLNGEMIMLELADDELTADTADIFRPLAIAG